MKNRFSWVMRSSYEKVPSVLDDEHKPLLKCEVSVLFESNWKLSCIITYEYKYDGSLFWLEIIGTFPAWFHSHSSFYLDKVLNLYVITMQINFCKVLIMIDFLLLYQLSGQAYMIICFYSMHLLRRRNRCMYQVKGFEFTPALSGVSSARCVFPLEVFMERFKKNRHHAFRIRQAET